MKKLRLGAVTLLLVFPLFLPIRVATAQLKATLEGHTNHVWSVAFSPDGSTLASGSWDQTVRLWGVDTAQLLHTLTGHTGEVMSVAFSPDGQTLASGSWYGNIRLWDPHTGKHKRTLNERRGSVASVAFSPDGDTLASGHGDHTIGLWNTTTWQLEEILTGHTSLVELVVFSTDGAALASGSRDKTIRLWNTHTGQHTTTLTIAAEVNRLGFSPDGATLASGSRDNVVRLWDAHTGQLKITLPNQGGWINPVAFSPDGATLLIGSHGISVWDTETAQYKVPLIEDTGGVLSLAFSPDGQTVASGSADNLVRLLDATPPEVPFATVPFDVNNIPEPVPPPKEVRDFFELDPFYQQWINVEGYPVLASEKVSPYAVKETAWHIKRMIGHRSDILKALAQNRVRFSIIAHNEVRSDLPEFRDTPLHFYYDVRQRGGAGGLGHRTTFGSEEQAFNSGSVNIHELAHDIHLVSLNQQIDPTFDNRLKTLFNAATAKGLWHGVTPNYYEYWAEAVTVWFHVPQLSPLKTREALKAYDPDVALLIAEVFGDNDWRYTPIRDRLHLPHLQGFDPESAPWVEFPPGVEEAYEELRDPAINERSEWGNLPPYDPSMLSHLNELRNRSQANRYSVGWTDILAANIMDAEILFYWVNPDGTETLHYRFPPNPWMIAHFPCRVGDLLLAKDPTGRNIAVFQAVEKTGRALVAPILHLIKPGLSIVSGDNQTGISGAVLANPFVVEVRGESLSVLEEIVVTFTVTAGDGTLSVTRTTTNANGRAESTLTLGQNLGTTTVSVSAAGIEGTVTFNATVEAAVDIPDSNLRAAIETALGKVPGALITAGEIATLPRLEAQNANITDLTGLEFATNLTELYLGAEWVEAERNWQTSNLVSNLSPLAGLTKLTRLDLRGNNISDLSPLAGLINLTYLELWDNHISDLSPLARLTNLTELRLGGNSVSNLSPLAGLTNLTTLLLQRNPISDLSPLAGLTNLTRLGVAGNNISDLLPLAGLTNLATLGLHGNRISDLSPLAGITNLAKVVLRNNRISDLSSLVANIGLGSGDTVKVQGNPLSYHSIHTYILALQNKGVTVEFDNRSHPALLKISGDNQNGASLTSLSHPFVVEAQDANGSALVGISVTFAVTAGGGTLNPTITRTDTNGRAQSTLTLGPNLGKNTIQVSATGIEVPATFHAVSETESPSIAADVNSDGSVNVLDLVVIASELGSTGTNLAVDVNGDGAVNVLDLIFVAGMFDGAAAAPSAQPQAPETLTAVEVQGWLTDARGLEVKDPIMKRGFLVLEQLLVSLTPKETELLPNYPNPFNPETWIPYRLAEDAFVTLTIYDTVGQVVRTLDVGHRIASAYESRSKAIYWDEKNGLGEQVASGVYFYTLTTGDFSATRRLVILK